MTAMQLLAQVCLCVLALAARTHVLAHAPSGESVDLRLATGWPAPEDLDLKGTQRVPGAPGGSPTTEGDLPDPCSVLSQGRDVPAQDLDPAVNGTFIVSSFNTLSRDTLLHQLKGGLHPRDFQLLHTMQTLPTFTARMTRGGVLWMCTQMVPSHLLESVEMDQAVGISV